MAWLNTLIGQLAKCLESWMSIFRLMSPMMRYGNIFHSCFCNGWIRTQFWPLFQDADAYIPGYKERALQEQIQQLVCYLWDNFLQLYDTDEIFLMGVGNAYLGVKVLLINRGTRTRAHLLEAQTTNIFLRSRLQIQDCGRHQLRYGEFATRQVRCWPGPFLMVQGKFKSLRRRRSCVLVWPWSYQESTETEIWYCCAQF